MYVIPHREGDMEFPEMVPSQDIPTPDGIASAPIPEEVEINPTGKYWSNVSAYYFDDDSNSDSESDSSNHPDPVPSGAGYKTTGEDTDSDKKPNSSNIAYPYDPSDTRIEVSGKPIKPKFDPTYYLRMVQVEHEEDTVVAANTMVSWHRVDYDRIDPKLIQPYLAFRPLHICKLTLKRTTQMAWMTIVQPLRRHLKT